MTGKEKRLRLVGKKQMSNLKGRNSASRQQLIFEHNMDRARLQNQMNALKEVQREERNELAKTILRLRTYNQKQTQGGLSQKFDDSNMDRQRERSRSRKQEQSPDAANSYDGMVDASQKSEHSRKRSHSRSLNR